MLPSKALFSVQKSVLIFLILFSCVLGNPLTRRQFSLIRKGLEKAAEELLGSDDKTKPADILVQEKYDEKNMTYYHAGDKSLPVFLSYGLNNIAKKVHVLLRGEDYMNPQDEHTFIVLKQLASDAAQYTVHSAYVENLSSLATGAIKWFDNLVEQKKNVKPLLYQMGNAEMQARSLRSFRPLCDWIGFLLLCDSPKDIAPIRKDRGEPMIEDEEETGAPLTWWMAQSSTEEEAMSPSAGGMKSKRQLPPNSTPKPVPTRKPESSSSRIVSKSAKSKPQVKAEATKTDLRDNNLGDGKPDEYVAKQEEETTPVVNKGNVNQEGQGRSFGKYDPKKHNDESSSSKKKHKKKHRKHNLRD
ncbi:unnamed protein product [Orchesella dallaii]|uniref:Uncharacterized protein n=1 Tax=Orchesella dallaii TaxID=48710 RepID=A0ABP1QW18_9HEXA